MEPSDKNSIDKRHEIAEKYRMGQLSAPTQWRTAPNGVNVAAIMANIYSLAEGVTLETVRTSVRLTSEQHQDIKLIAKLWNDLDKTLGARRRRKWSDASVIERLISVGIDGFWAQVGGRPETEKGRREFVDVAAERIRKSQQHHEPKK